MIFISKLYVLLFIPWISVTLLIENKIECHIIIMYFSYYFITSSVPEAFLGYCNLGLNYFYLYFFPSIKGLSCNKQTEKNYLSKNHRCKIKIIEDSFASLSRKTELNFFF